MHERPVDAHDSLTFETLQRFREGQVTGPLFFVEADLAEIGSAFGGTNGHDAMIFQEGLKVPVRFWLLPKKINLGPAAFFDHDPKARGFDLEQFH